MANEIKLTTPLSDKDVEKLKIGDKVLLNGVIYTGRDAAHKRLVDYAPLLMEAGIKGMIGKGSRSDLVREAMKKYKAVYFAAIGGAAALLSEQIKKAEVIAYEDLGTEAVRRLEVEDFPVIVVNDVKGGDLYEEGVKKYSRI